MAKELLPDALGLRIAPLIPPEAPKPKDGRPRISDRAALDSAAVPAPGGRYEHRADIHLAFLQLGCALISLRFLG